MRLCVCLCVNENDNELGAAQYNYLSQCLRRKCKQPTRLRSLALHDCVMGNICSTKSIVFSNYFRTTEKSIKMVVKLRKYDTTFRPNLLLIFKQYHHSLKNCQFYGC